ncbi:MAG: hypothetical protein K1X92_09000 [Bacteroidia bacterium]|nr:hypothetical protein [Bacteroidia bacterium]
MIAWLWALVKPVAQLHSAPSVLHPVRFPNCLVFDSPSFLSFRLHSLLRASVNGEVIVLERLLNLFYYAFFDSTQARGTQGYWIYIEDKDLDIGYPFVYLDVENRPLPVYSAADYTPPLPLPDNGSSSLEGPQYLYQLSDYYGPVDFIVYVPQVLPFNQTEMEILINQYKLAATKYIIQVYS